MRGRRSRIRRSRQVCTYTANTCTGPVGVARGGDLEVTRHVTAGRPGKPCETCYRRPSLLRAAHPDAPDRERVAGAVALKCTAHSLQIKGMISLLEFPQDEAVFRSTSYGAGGSASIGRERRSCSPG